MADRMTRFKCFTVPEWEKEQDYLREQHKRGWKLVRVTFPGFYHFEKCTPEDVVYQLDYNTEGIEHRAEYIQMFGDCGWEYILDFVGYSYFRKPVSEMSGEEEIFCDYDSRMEMIKRVFRGRIIPLIVIFFGCLLPQFFVQCSLRHPLNVNKVLTVALGILLVVYMISFIKFGLCYMKIKKRTN